MFKMPLGEGLELRLLEQRHAEEIFQVVDANRERLREWLPWVDFTKCAADTEGFLLGQMARLAHGESMSAGLWVDGAFAGIVEGQLEPVNRTMDIGYWISGAYEGRGLVARACRELCRYAFEDLGYERIELRSAADNRRSCAVAERLGMKLEGVLRSAFRLRELRWDMNLYALLAEDWESAGPS